MIFFSVAQRKAMLVPTVAISWMAMSYKTSSGIYSYAKSYITLEVWEQINIITIAACSIAPLIAIFAATKFTKRNAILFTVNFAAMFVISAAMSAFGAVILFSEIAFSFQNAIWMSLWIILFFIEIPIAMFATKCILRYMEKTIKARTVMVTSLSLLTLSKVVFMIISPNISIVF